MSIDIDPVAVERAVEGDTEVALTAAEMQAAWQELEAQELPYDDIADALGVSGRTVVRWRGGLAPTARPGTKPTGTAEASIPKSVGKGSITRGLSHSSAAIVKAAERARDAVARLDAMLQEDEGKAAARAEVKRLEAQLAAAEARLRGGPTPAAASPVGKASNNEPSRRKLVTEWAVEEGLIEVGRRGQLPQAIYAYDHAHL